MTPLPPYAQPTTMQPVHMAAGYPQQPALPSYQPPVQPQGTYPPQVQPQGTYPPQVQPQAIYPPVAAQPTVPVVVQQAIPMQIVSQGLVYQTATPIAALNMSSVPVDCPACGQRGLTTITHEPGGTTHAWAALLCFCFCLGCIPYLMTSLQDVVHRCSKCGAQLATWHRSGYTQVHINGP